MSRWVVDASVAFKWFIAEPYFEAARRLLAGEHKFLAPDLLLPEIGNILCKKVRRGELAREEGQKILNVLSQAPIEIHPSGPILASAFHIAVERECSLYDGLYVSLALVENCVLVTADRKLLNRFRDDPFGGRLLWVEEIA